MMDVSQNMELKELSAESALMRNLSSDLGSEVETLSTPAIETSGDDEVLCEFTNGVDSSDNKVIKDIDKKLKGSEQERNAGSDLDALLDKISSIVDCSPKNSDDMETLDNNKDCDSASIEEKTAAEKQSEEREREVEEEEGEILESVENEERMEQDSELKTEEKSSAEEIEETEDIDETTPTKESKDNLDVLAGPNEDKIEEVTDANETSEEKDEAKAQADDIKEKVRAKRVASTDDVFMDALDSISSSDELDAPAVQDEKKAKHSKELSTEDKQAANDLEDISSDDDDGILKDKKVDEVDKSEQHKLDIIDLDSSNECQDCETPMTVEKAVAKSEDIEKVTKNKGSPENTDGLEENISEEPDVQEEKEEEKFKEANKAEEKEKLEGIESISIEEPEEIKEIESTEEDKKTNNTKTECSEEANKLVDLHEVQEIEESEETKKDKVELEESKLPKITKVTEGSEEVNTTKKPEETKEREQFEVKKKREKSEKAESTAEPDEPFVVEEETKDPKTADQLEAEPPTKSQEMNDNTTDEEAAKDTLEIDEKTPAKNKPMIVSENDKEPKLNGVCEKSTEKDFAGEKHLVEKEAKDTDSDDEVIFFEPIDKTNPVETAAQSTSEKPEKPQTQPTSEKPEKPQDKDDEVVLVSEDEDEEPQVKPPEKEMLKSPDKETTTVGLSSTSTEVKDLHTDNSDNACDQFEKLKTNDKVKSTGTDDGNSNSSNLLRPAEDLEVSAPKRIRLSVEEKIDSALENQKPSSGDECKKDIKRSHELLDNSPDREEVTPNKKPKTDDSDSNSSNDGTLQIDMDRQEDEVQTKKDALKTEDENKPKIELKPKPEIKTDVKPIRLEFFKTFRSTFDKMSRDDLEELVLQKVVEAMLVKSDFADIRMQLDKCENTLTTYRRKIAEVTKQFQDLETVHKRVLKDLESKNSHFIAPVRITRAVGLQVGIPFKAMKPTVAAPDQPHAAGSVLTPPTGTPPKASTSPMRSPMRARPPPPAFGSSSTGLNTVTSVPPSPNYQQQQSRSSANSLQTTAAVATAQPPVRRGCLQKVTPQRPGPGNILPVSQANTQPNVHRLQSSPPVGQRTTHASKHTGSTASLTASTPNATAKAAMRSRNSTPAYVQQQPQQPTPPQYQTSRSGPGATPGPSSSKAPKCTTKVRAQQPPLSGATVSVPMASAVGSGAGSGAYAQQQQPSLAPAKPKEKAVIDLTDEDDAAAAAAAKAIQAQIEANARLRQASNAAIKRNAQVAASSRGGRGGGSVVRASPMQLGRVSARQIVQNNGAGQRSTGSNITMQIRSENTPPASSRLRYSHPAPLPSSPAQPFNPAWKMPPSRPVIRINLLDTGIVISWTLEDTSPKFAECVTYQIYAYQETIHEPSTDSWRHVGDVNAMLLPMAVTLNQFQENQRYYFAVRGVDNHQRFGPFSAPKTWS
ncbi:myb-like protein X [Drosophila eugracilis]|uniref:myb-like protein X n=1 Tax=Drosophila eugracilis TaxID=29029 RepID=UPI0007E6D8A9|nr:myb-like protein X [Drosophila eugracilis]XP_017078874.1 myb-like protein X [Drosophila eugracilis]XP_017078875.1 myb-like protein X [Drosophila eugracilis]